MEQFAEISSAFSDLSRLKALAMLREGEQCVCTITDELGLAASTVSRHMSILRDAGLVTSRKAGKWIYYRLNEDASAVCKKLLGVFEESCPRSSKKNVRKKCV